MGANSSYDLNFCKQKYSAKILSFFLGGGISSLIMQSLIVEFGSRERRFYFDELSKLYCQPRNCEKRFEKDTVAAALEQTSTYFASKLEAN